ncbi:LURP-one-related/scramblase family protein [Bergeyella zoohelcum]|uniref:LURP-one-related family protein n=2 Tax=Bergeyella zoohelcum TaxID=1015 RepID=K1LZX2_9FLAO|nr:hypothetical protein [Bergeyella zoohelcum]EKB57587.1 hypothetical protein HMPREF9699_01073 [Bergeyella zoohelcum ATCC 43767]SUV48743.1 Uncharacterised protein [Bergeyella zoohelcum]VDH02768.1 Uncharacterised protein [Bergeyella zoohelcum]
MKLQNLNYPLDFKFRLTTLASDFNITDAHGNFVAYVRQKLFKLKEEVVVFNNNKKEQEIFKIKANKWLDFNASYEIANLLEHKSQGKITRKGMRSFWKSTYQIFDGQSAEKYSLTEDNAWVKVLDGFFGELPVIGMFTGYFFNPSYSVKDASGRAYFQLKKMPSFFGRRFQLHKLNEVPEEDETLIILSLLMMVLLERARG